MPSTTPLLKRYALAGWLPLMLLALCLLSIIIVFNTPLLHLHTLWLNNDDGYSHGYLVLAISIYLLYENRQHYQTLPTAPSSLAFVLFLGTLLLLSITSYLNIAALQIPLLLPLFWFALGAIAGLPLLRATAFPILFLFFAMPIWDLLLPLLQSVTVSVSKDVLQALQITAFYHGDTVTLPYGDVIIEQSCSGLRYLTISLTLSALYYHLNFSGHRLRGGAMILCAILLALISNWARVTYIIYVAYTSKMQDSLVADHHNFGWILYSVSLLPFFLIAHYLQPKLAPLTPSPSIEKTTDAIHSSKNQNQSKTQTDINTRSNVSHSLLASALAASLCIGLIIGIPHYTETFKRQPAPHQLLSPTVESPWEKSTAYLSPLHSQQWQPTFYGFDYSEHAHFTHPSLTKPIRLDLYGYLWQEQGKELISDRHFIVHRKYWHATNLPAINIHGVKIYPLIVTGKKTKRLIWSWYKVAKMNTGHKRLAKIYELGNFALAEKQASIVIALSIACQSDCQSSENELKQAITELNLFDL